MGKHSRLVLRAERTWVVLRRCRGQGRALLNNDGSVRLLGYHVDQAVWLLIQNNKNSVSPLWYDMLLRGL